MAYFPYVTLRSDVTFPAFFAVLQMASSSRFVDLSEDDIIKTKTQKDDIRYRFFQEIYNSSEDRDRGHSSERTSTDYKEFHFVCTRQKNGRVRAVVSQSNCPQHRPFPEKKELRFLCFERQSILRFPFLKRNKNN